MVLTAANQPPEVIKLVDDIVATCEICRTCTLPQSHPVATSSLSTKFNEQVEADLCFFQKKIIFHMICRCIRWHAAKEVLNKDTATLIAAITEIWIGLHGPPKEFLMDGETEGIFIPFPRLLAEAVFAGNALISINSKTFSMAPLDHPCT